MQEPTINAADRLLAGAAPRTALVFGTRTVCYGELRLAAARAAWAWQDCGVQPGDTVLLRIAPGFARTVALLGAVWAGAVPVPLGRAVAAEDWQPWARDAGCRFVLDDTRAGHANEWRDQVLTQAEWQVALEESQPLLPALLSPVAPACWTDFDGQRQGRLLAHGWFLAGERPASQEAIAGQRNAHVGSTLGLLRALRRGATVVLSDEQPAPVAAAPRAARAEALQ